MFMGVPRSPCSVQGFLGAPLQPFQVRIISPRCHRALGFFGFALDSTGFFFALLHLLRFFSIAFRDGGFACSCDGSLLLFVFPDR